MIGVRQSNIDLIYIHWYKSVESWEPNRLQPKKFFGADRNLCLGSLYARNIQILWGIFLFFLCQSRKFTNGTFIGVKIFILGWLSFAVVRVPGYFWLTGSLEVQDPDLDHWEWTSLICSPRRRDLTVIFAAQLRGCPQQGPGWPRGAGQSPHCQPHLHHHWGIRGHGCGRGRSQCCPGLWCEIVRCILSSDYDVS